MFPGRRRAAAREREERLATATRLLEQFERLHTRVLALEQDLRERALREEAMVRRLFRAEAELALEKVRREGLEQELAAQPQASLKDELGPLWSHLGSQRELLHGLARRVELAVQRLHQPMRALEAPRPEVREPEGAEEHLLFVAGPGGYALVERSGPAPAPGSVVDMGDGLHVTILKLGPSPLPADARRCAHGLPAAASSRSDARAV